MRPLLLSLLLVTLWGCRTVPREIDLHPRPHSVVYIPDRPGTDAYFPGGLTAWSEHVKAHRVYPAEVRKRGRVFVSFSVNADGSLGEFKIGQSLHPALDANAIEVVKRSSPWIPATNEKGEKITSHLSVIVPY